MIGARFTPHHTHSLAVLVRVAATIALIACAVLIPVSFAGVALHHLAMHVALTRVLVAVGITSLILLVARRLDPLRR